MKSLGQFIKENISDSEIKINIKINDNPYKGKNSPMHYIDGTFVIEIEYDDGDYKIEYMNFIDEGGVIYVYYAYDNWFSDEIYSLIKNELIRKISNEMHKKPCLDTKEYCNIAEIVEKKREINESKTIVEVSEMPTNKSELLNIWDRCVDLMGAEGMLDALFDAMSSDEIRDNLEYFDRMYDLDLLGEEDDEEDDEEY